MMSRRILYVLMFFVTASEHQSLMAAELIMLEQKGCSWCDRWRAEIGVVYHKTAEGKRAPLRIVNINEPVPEDLAFLRIERFTPTFVLVDKGVEIGRLRGYTGNEFFWFLLSEQLNKLPGDQQADES